MSSALQSLAYEIKGAIFGNLSSKDASSIRISCRKFHDVIDDLYKFDQRGIFVRILGRFALYHFSIISINLSRVVSDVVNPTRVQLEMPDEKVILRYLICDINKWDLCDLCTVLHLAAEMNLMLVAQFLFDDTSIVRNKIESRDNRGSTPLIRAAANGHKEMTEFLLTSGAPVEAKDNDGRTALHLAAKHGHKEMTEILLTSGVKVEAEDDDGWTALHLAAMYGRKEVTEILLTNGAKVEAEDNDGRTALHWAVINEHKEVIEILLTSGAKVEAKDNDGRTALHLAAKHGHKEVTEILLTSGANVEAKENNGRTALDWAAILGYTGVTEMPLMKATNFKAHRLATP